MDCTRFREQHVGYVDDLLSAEGMAEMGEHLHQCPACAHHDIAVRRGLLLARNLPRVHCSADFMERLHARLREGGPVERPVPSPWWHARQAGTFAVLAASLLAAAGLATWATTVERAPEVVRLAPVVASAPAPEPAPLSAPSYMVAPLAVGLPVWSVVLAADETPMHMANEEMREAMGLTR